MYSHQHTRRASLQKFTTLKFLSHHHHHHHHQHHDDVENHHHTDDTAMTSRSPSPSRSPVRTRQPSTCSNISSTSVSELWRCMLELQGEYGCYNSRRIDLAMEVEDGLALMPSRFIIDTLNDSVVDLPEEGWEKLDRYLRNTGGKME